MRFFRSNGASCHLLLAVSISIPCIASAVDDGASLYRAKCATCHGKQGTGKRSTKAPSLVSDKVKSMSDDTIRDLVASRTNGEMEKKSAHTSLKKRLTSDQITALVAHIRELQKAK